MDIQWKYKRGRGVVYVLCHYGMVVVGRGLHQELWYAVDDNVINSALHGGKASGDQGWGSVWLGG